MLLTMSAVVFYALTAGGGLMLAVLAGYFIVYYFQNIIRNRMRGRGSATAANIGVNLVLAFLIFFVVFNGYYYFSSFETGDYYEKRGFYLQGQENPLTFKKLAGQEVNRKVSIDTVNVHSEAFYCCIAMDTC